jgi:hypothetical protein
MMKKTQLGAGIIDIAGLWLHVIIRSTVLLLRHNVDVCMGAPQPMRALNLHSCNYWTGVFLGALLPMIHSGALREDIE